MKINTKLKNIHIILILIFTSIFSFIIYYILPCKDEVTFFFEWLVICIHFIINFLLIGVGYNQDIFHINKITDRILILMMIWFTSFSFYVNIYEVSNILNTVTLILSFVTMIIFLNLYINPVKHVIDIKNTCANGLYPILQQHQKFFSSAKNVIVLFQSTKKIKVFTIKKKNIEEIYYPVFLSPNLIEEHYLVCYLREKDISDLNLTSYSDKIINFKGNK